MSDDRDHPLLTLVGLAAVTLGVLMVVQPGLAAAVGTDYTAVTVVAFLAVVQALRVARARKATEVRSAETPDVESVEAMPTPGDDFDREVAALRSGPRRTMIHKRADLHETLKATAITAVAERENCSREAARERIEAGTWTDDVYAASFLGGTEAPNPPLLARVKVAASGLSAHQFHIRRSADAVARVAGVVDASESTEGGESDADAESATRSESTEAGGEDARETAETAEHREVEA